MVYHHLLVVRVHKVTRHRPHCSLRRIHAEFQLNDVPNFPFWFTPGQFAGNIVLSKDASHVRHFHLYVPNDRLVSLHFAALALSKCRRRPAVPARLSVVTSRSLNVDMEWLYGASESSNMEVDIGYLPQVRLLSPNNDNKSY